MLKTFLELIIAVTFVFTVEAVSGFFTETESAKVRLILQFDGSREGFWTWWQYVFPAIALAVHTVALAHYHQKRESWRVVDAIAKKINGRFEIAQYAAIGGSIIMLVLATKFLPELQHRYAIVLFWGLAFFFYSLGDILTLRLTKESEVPEEFLPLRKWMLLIDLLTAMAGVCFAFLLDAKNAGLVFSLVAFVATGVHYWIGWKFMTTEPPKQNYAETCPLFGRESEWVKKLCPLNPVAQNQEQEAKKL